MASTLKYWKEAATLLLAARVKTPISAYLGKKKYLFDFQTLVLQRTAKAGFFPSAQVFPGGGIDKADFSPDWLDVFQKYSNVNSTADFGHLINVAGMRPPMLLRDHPSPVPVDVAYRICAIRETFEESGILLLRNASETFDAGWDRVPLGRCVAMDAEDLKSWRELVHRDANNFLSLCRKLQGVPDVWSLAEWSNWLTPSDITNRRFDTIFYISCLDHLPEALEDNTEIVKSMWETPLESLQHYSNGETFLPPPQLYELRRLLNFDRFDDLYAFCQRRASDGVERYLPVRCDCKDGLISLLPGDDDYPSQPVEETGEDHRLQIDETVDTNTSSKSSTNRIIFRSPTEYSVDISAKPNCGHLTPVVDHLPSQKIASNM